MMNALQRVLSLAIALALIATTDAVAQSVKRGGASQEQEQKPEVEIPTLPQNADPSLDDALAAYQRGFYQTAFKSAAARVDKNPNDGAAMTLLGELYAQGFGVKQDLIMAAAWYRRAADLGDMNAALALGMMHLQGRGVAADRKLGLELLAKAADKGHPAAAYNLALVLLGSGSTTDLEHAATILQRAADGDLGDAQYALAVLYKEGRGVARDMNRAATLMKKASDHQVVAAQVEYAIMLFNGDNVGRDEEAAAKLFARAAGKGNAIAQNRLARLLVAGRGVRKDMVEAASWHLAASRQGLTDSWLDEALKSLSDEERKKAQELAELRGAGGDSVMKP
jgi:TPR repeat protein